jgi:DMSO/TMAO reductase YedYZ molybdopterin-dependent catalytic subunit
MSNISRRKLITSAIASAAGVAGAAVAVDKLGLIPPAYQLPYALGDSLTYASQRLLTNHTMAREFSRDQISRVPFPNPTAPKTEAFKKHEAAGFADWKLVVSGMVARPATFSIPDIKKFPASSQITQIACEEGWSYVAEWIGTPLSHILEAVGIDSKARYVVYASIEKDWWDSVDMSDALHPQTILTYGMNGGELPVGYGGPLRVRVPRQLGYKSVKFINQVTVIDNLKSYEKSLPTPPPPSGYSWYAGI